VAVPGHSYVRIAIRFRQSTANQICHIAALGDGRTAAPGEANHCCQNQFGLDERGGVAFGGRGTKDVKPRAIYRGECFQNLSQEIRLIVNPLASRLLRTALFTVSFITPKTIAAAAPDSKKRPSES